MDIPFTQAQYRTLLLMVYLGNWTVNAHKVDPDKAFDELANYLYSFAGSFGIKGLVEMSPDNGKYYPTSKLEEVATGYMEEYDNETFWEELIDRLTERDFLAEYGEDAIREMTPEERFLKREELAKRYQEEFEERGLEHLTVR